MLTVKKNNVFGRCGGGTEKKKKLAFVMSIITLIIKTSNVHVCDIKVRLNIYVFLLSEFLCSIEERKGKI